jgi:hypothetical protein
MNKDDNTAARELVAARNEFKIASAELEEAKNWSQTLTQNLHKLQENAIDEKQAIRKELYKKN